VIAALGVLVVPAVSSGAKPLVIQTRGAISRITAKRIEVRRVVCALPSERTQRLAARFAVGDQVSIVCRNGVLARLDRARAATNPPPPSTGPTVTITIGGEPTTRGTITAFGPDGITINGITCAISPELYSVIGSEYSVGDTATIVCDQSGRLRAIGPRGV